MRFVVIHPLFKISHTIRPNFPPITPNPIQNLMQKEDLDKLGFKEDAAGGGSESGGEGKKKGEGRDEAFYDRRREAEGFVAGTGVKSGRKGFFS